MKPDICWPTAAYAFFFSLCFSFSTAQDIPVNHFTGQPMIGIPLVTVTDRNLSVPVMLTYDAKGVLINSSSTWVGQNWSLHGDGQVSRELRGLPDDYSVSGNLATGWLYNANASTIGNYANFPLDGSGLSCANEDVVYNFINNLNYNVDTEPDLFHFSAGDISGTFMFDNTGDINNIKLIPYQDVQVKAYRNINPGPITKFEIITASGVKYVFSTLNAAQRKTSKVVGQPDPFYFQTDYHQYKIQRDYTSAWMLTSIESAVGEKIQFAYTQYPTTSVEMISHALTGTTDNGAPPEISAYEVTEFSSRMTLTSISSPHTIVTFNTEHNPDGSLVLNNIVANEINAISNKYLKAILFAYDVGYVNSRRFLKSVQVVDDCVAYQPYQFEYLGTVNLPVPGSASQDIWGYHHNTGAAHMYPKLYVYPSQAGINRISLYPKTGQADEIVIPGANRVTEGTSLNGVLTRIVYPTGATAGISYEPNEFYNPIKGSYSKGAGLRVSSIEVYDGITSLNTIRRSFEYKKPDGTSSGQLLTMPSFWLLSACSVSTSGSVTPYSSLSGLPAADQWKKLLIRTDKSISADFGYMPTVAYEYVTEMAGNNSGKTLYQFELPFTYGASASGDWNPTYVHLARKSTSGSCPSPALNVPSFYQHPSMPQTPYDFKRGMLISMKQYKQSDAVNPEVEVVNEYQDKSISATAIIGLRYQWVPVETHGQRYFMYGAYKLSTNKLRLLTRTTERLHSKTSPASYIETITDYTYPTNHVQLKSVAVTNSDGTVTKSLFKYVKDYGAPQATDANTDLQVKMIDALYASGQTGALVEQVKSVTPSGGTETTIEGVVQLFKDFGTTTAIIRPIETYGLVTSGIINFPLSSITGTGATRIFNKNGAYKKTGILAFGPFGDLQRAEDRSRQVQSFHTDNLTGLPVATVFNANPGEVVYSNFDQETQFDFDLSAGFTSNDKIYGGRRTTIGYGLGGWKFDWAATKYLSKTFVKKPGKKYVFSAWYMAGGTTGTHSLNVIIKNTGGTQLLAQTLTYTVAAANTWYHNEMVMDLSSIGDTEITVEVKFNGTANPKALISGALDDVTFVPEDAVLQRNTVNSAYGQLSQINPDGTIIDNEYLPNGLPKNVRDKDGNILQKTSFSTYLPNGATNVPIAIGTAPEIYDNIQTTLTAFTACLDITTLEWKVTPASNPTGGTFFTGSNQQPYTFNASGNFIVTLKISHITYGSYEVSKTVTVALTPIDVDICVYDGPVTIDLCLAPTITETLDCNGTPTIANYLYTTFTATASGCSAGATYTYTWYRRQYGNQIDPYVNVGTGSQITLTNAFSYDVKCVVTSDCNRQGESSAIFVYVYKTDPACADPIQP
jgi:hypothetical protein